MSFPAWSIRRQIIADYVSIKTVLLSPWMHMIVKGMLFSVQDQHDSACTYHFVGLQRVGPPQFIDNLDNILKFLG